MGHTPKIVLGLALFAAVLSISQAQTAPNGPAALQFQTQSPRAASSSVVIVPAGTQVVLALKSPVWAKTAKVGDAVYTATIFPVAVNNQIAIPPGTYVSGQIDALTRPGLFSSHAQFLMHFTQLIYPNGYTVAFQPSPWIDSLSLNQATVGTDTSAAQPSNSQTSSTPETLNIQAAVASVYVQVSSRSDILLDNGTQIEMVLQNPLSLNAVRVADSARRFRAPQVGPVATASLCRPIPATPGTPDTVIPGTPGTPGTPDTVIPGGPGMPDTVIPGTPATPGTPDTVIPGTPGTPGVACPEPPYVVSNPPPKDVHTESFQLLKPAALGGQHLPAGTYQATWNGLSSSAVVQIQQNRKRVATANARIVFLDKASPDTQASARENSDGSLALHSLRFAARFYALLFD